MERHSPYIDWIDTQHHQMCRRVINWANINSGTGNVAGLERLASEVRREFTGLGGTVETLAPEPSADIDAAGRLVPMPLGPALRVVKRPDAPLRVWVCIHLDTVYPPDDPFQSVAAVDGNTLRGPGVADAKGGLAVMLTALEALERSPLASGLGWEVLLNPDEEISSPGSAPWLTRGARRNHLGLLVEPALPGGALADRRRGVGNFTLVLRGRSAHAGRDFDRGRSAVVAMADFILQAHALNAALPGVTVNVGRDEGGGRLTWCRTWPSAGSTSVPRVWTTRAASAGSWNAWSPRPTPATG